ncbi:MAG: trigger factor, partial [Caldilineae bacterium]
MTVEIDEQQKEKLYKKAARRIAREIRIPGFRPGKAPYNIILNRFGIEVIQEEALEDLTTDIFHSALEEADLEPYRQASLDSIEWEPLVMKVKVPTEPVVELGDYRSLRLDVPEIEVTDEEINQQLDHLLEHYTTYNPVERPAQSGDFVSIVVTEKDAETGEVLLADHQATLLLAPPQEGEPDFEAHLGGFSAGEETVFTHTFPDDFSMEHYAGMTIEYTIRVEAVKEKEEIELDDEFAALVGDYDSLDDLKAKIRQNLIEQKNAEVDSQLASQAVEALLEQTENIHWPAVLEEEVINSMLDEERRNLERGGMDFETYLKTRQMTEEAFREELRPKAQEHLRRTLLLGEIARREEIDVHPQEVMDYLQHLISPTVNLDLEELLKGEEGDRLVMQVFDHLLQQKTLQRLARIVRGEAETEPDTSEPEAEPEPE